MSIERRNPVSRMMARLCRQYLRHQNGYSYDFVRGGEQNVLRRLAQLPVRTIFDVGANVGDWSKIAARYLPQANFHTFELSAATYASLVENLNDSRFRHNHCALSDQTGTLTYKDYGANSGVNTILTQADYHDARITPKEISANVTTGDLYAKAHGIEAIDFLKIDVEGAEHLVLKGFAGMLASGSIRCLQFEYGYTNGDVHFLMRDFYKLLGGYGYVIARVRRWPLKFEEFHYSLNDFDSGPNYLAIQKGDTEAQAALTA
ncbi:MAG: FkbM family methyltransferase [Steroidobacteraceae bacterium]